MMTIEQEDAMALRHQQSLADRWNRRYAVGQRVRVRSGDGRSFETVTNDAACVVGEHTAAVWVDGYLGYVELAWVEAVVDGSSGTAKSRRFRRSPGSG